MRAFSIGFVIVCIVTHSTGTAEEAGVRGDPEAIADAKAMVEAMGGLEIWSQLESLHFVHEWHPWYRVDSYIENEILDLTGPRSWVEERSEIHHKIRAYSPEHRYWSIVNGEFSYGDQSRLDAAMERAPYSIYRIARAVAAGDSDYEFRFGKGDIPGARQLEIYGSDGNMHGRIILNARREPLVWATTQYRYMFGPMERYGNLRVPKWAIYENGITYYEMVSLIGSNQPPDGTLFAPPDEFAE